MIIDTCPNRFLIRYILKKSLEYFSAIFARVQKQNTSTYIYYTQLLIYNFCKHRNKPYSKLYNLTNNAATPPWSAANALFRFQNKRKNGNNNITTWWGGLKVRWLLFGKHQQHRSKLWPLVSNPKKIERVQLTILVQVTTAFIGPSKS